MKKTTDIETETQPEVKPERYTKSDEPSQAPQVACTEASNENTSDAQPLAESCHGLPLTRAHLSNEAATLLETLSDVAESEHNGEAANMLLQGIHGYPHEVRNIRDLVEITDKLLGIRQRIVTLMAVQECSRDPRWSQEQWRQWINSFTFDRRMMNDAIDIWRDQIFVDDMSEITRQKEELAQTHGQRREIRRGAFRAWQKEQYGQAAIAKIFVKFQVTNLAELLEDWQTDISSLEYTEQRLRSLPKHAACQPPVASQTSDVYMEGRGNGSLQRGPCTFIASRDAPGSIDRFRKFVADTPKQHLHADHADQPATAPATDQNAVAADDNSATPPAMSACSPPDSIPLWGRGSRHYEELAKLRHLRKQAVKGKEDARTMAWFQSGGLDRRLQQLTLEHGAGRYWDREGYQIDLRPTAFEDHLARSNRT